jgi:hypothetical protein
MNTSPTLTFSHSGNTCRLVRDPFGQRTLRFSAREPDFEFSGQASTGEWVAPLSPANAAALRAHFVFLNPVPLGLHTSAGLGDRLGLATPGHARAVAETRLAPIFAQQSVRENARTGRTPQQVVDDALWGLVEAGWQQPWGADADHIKLPSDLPAFFSAGYTFFTADPGDYVHPEADRASLAELRARFSPDQRQELAADYLGRSYDLSGVSLSFDETSLLRAAAKYSAALDHTVALYRQVKAHFASADFDFELSVDETDTPTTPLEHVYVASELARRGVRWVSLAPRFVGRFEKGVDYLGDLGEFEAQIAQHAAIARIFGGYKLSLHSGSDKFSIYPIAARHTRGHVHLKTAGTSYLEALRVLARLQPAFFRQIFILSLQRYAADRVSYHVSAQPERIPALDTLFDSALPSLLDQFDARQVLHVAFGTVLAQYGEPLKAFLEAHAEDYAADLHQHFQRHLQPFIIPA